MPLSWESASAGQWLEDGAPVSARFDYPPGMAANRAMFWGFIDRVTGTLRHRERAPPSIPEPCWNSESVLPEPTVNSAFCGRPG